MAREHVVYTGRWFTGAFGLVARDICRSIAFGVILFVGVAFLVGPMIYMATAPSESVYDTDPTAAAGGEYVLVLFVIGIPMCVFCWWAALEVADDRHWEKRGATIWDDQRARWIASSVKMARYLESQGKTREAAIILSDDIYAEAHRLIDETDEATVRIMLAAILAGEHLRAGESVWHADRRLLE